MATESARPKCTGVRNGSGRAGSEPRANAVRRLKVKTRHDYDLAGAQHSSQGVCNRRKSHTVLATHLLAHFRVRTYMTLHLHLAACHNSCAHSQNKPTTTTMPMKDVVAGAMEVYRSLGNRSGNEPTRQTRCQSLTRFFVRSGRSVRGKLATNLRHKC